MWLRIQIGDGSSAGTAEVGALDAVPAQVANSLTHETQGLCAEKPEPKDLSTQVVPRGSKPRPL